MKTNESYFEVICKEDYKRETNFLWETQSQMEGKLVGAATSPPVQWCDPRASAPQVPVTEPQNWRSPECVAVAPALGGLKSSTARTAISQAEGLGFGIAFRPLPGSTVPGLAGQQEQLPESCLTCSLLGSDGHAQHFLSLLFI